MLIHDIPTILTIKSLPSEFSYPTKDHQFNETFHDPWSHSELKRIHLCHIVTVIRNIDAVTRDFFQLQKINP